IVRAVESRVTLNGETKDRRGNTIRIQAHYDNGTKLLKVRGQDYAAAVTYGLGALGIREPRTAHSYIPEFEAELANLGRLELFEFAEKLGDFFARQHRKLFGNSMTDDIVFLVGGYNDGENYGRVYEVKIPSNPTPIEHNAKEFGLTLGGQGELASRCLNTLPIPYQFLPLQSCIDLSIILIRTTMQLLEFTFGVRGVGGHIDVAAITRENGYQVVQIKQINGGCIHPTDEPIKYSSASFIPRP
ncbi:MAG: hypothetical protein ABL907_00340, partial [Hyphomicrobium sp.]